ncbi:hypothetical protein FIBSPDRAFT_398704 [Athelia psychrophila]|uniref:Uncharacterized protein n=1 Tax=Athelia psychrophila TaxID=1759441 RepID=A0A167UZX1_9AGAM|nr:hypothetical protein FIBSPDRAFT_398704 [Fibularhizoctonia sp. CBS 109695]
MLRFWHAIRWQGAVTSTRKPGMAASSRPNGMLARSRNNAHLWILRIALCKIDQMWILLFLPLFVISKDGGVQELVARWGAGRVDDGGGTARAVVKGAHGGESEGGEGKAGCDLLCIFSL